MKRNINNALSFKKYTKRLFSISLFFLFISQGYSQTYLPKKAKLKTITYSDYTISGYVLKNQFVEDQKLTFIARTNSYGVYLTDTILSGRYFYNDDGNSYIEGIRAKRGHNVNSITEGIFKVANTNNKVGITTKKREGEKLGIIVVELTYYEIDYYDYSKSENITLILRKLTDNKFSLKIKYESLIVETVIPYSLDSEVSDNFRNDILDSKKVTLSFNNGDVFTGMVKSSSKLPPYSDYDAPYAPDNGEYRYGSGEVSTGVFEYNNYLERFYLGEGVTVFTDGSICNGDWLYDQNLTNSEQERIYSKDRTPTEMQNMAKSIIEEKERKLQEEKAAQEQAEKERFRQQQLRRTKLIEKYGEYYGNKISEGELVLGMSQEMVNEYWPKKYFSISNINRNHNKTEIWEFDKNKLQREIIKEGKESGNEDGALSAILLLNFSEQLGGIDSPKMLVFKNNELTDIYR